MKWGFSRTSGKEKGLGPQKESWAEEGWRLEEEGNDGWDCWMDGFFCPLSASLETLEEKGQCEGRGLFGVLISKSTLLSPLPSSPSHLPSLSQGWGMGLGW